MLRRVNVMSNIETNEEKQCAEFNYTAGESPVKYEVYPKGAAKGICQGILVSFFKRSTDVNGLCAWWLDCSGVTRNVVVGQELLEYLEEAYAASKKFGDSK
jgi:hypothetical protein